MLNCTQYRFTAGCHALLLAAAVLIAAATDPPAAPQAGVIAQRGPVSLTAADVRDAVSRADPALRAQLMSNPAALANFVRDRLLQAGLAADARAKGFDQRPDVVQRMNDARDAVLVQSFLAAQAPVEPGFPTEGDVMATYDANKQRFLLPKQYNLAQLFVPVAQGASRDADEEAHRRAIDLRAQAVKPKADFNELAKKSPQGLVGWVREDQLVPGVKETVMALPDGAVSDPVRSPAGWHVIKLSGVRPPAPAPVADVHDQIVVALRQARQQAAIKAYVEGLLKQQPIQLNEIDLAKAVAAQ